MSDAQDNRRVAPYGPGPAKPVTHDALQQGCAVDAEPCAFVAGDPGDGLGGHTLLAHSPAPQGRRSLFRR